MKLYDYLMIQFKWNGRDFDGCDCYGLIMLYYKHELGIKLRDYQHNQKHEHKIDAKYYKDNALNDFEEVDKPRANDCVIMYNSKGERKHIGIILKNNVVMHITRRMGTISVPLRNIKPYKFYRYRG